MICNICPRKCNKDRAVSLGFCSSPEAFRVARAALHFWEEPCISGKNGSGAVFFSGCNLKCVYCQNYEISRQNKGVEVSGERLAHIFESLILQGAHNINLVNPTHYSAALSRLFEKWKSPVPIVYNSGGYDGVEALKSLRGKVDIYMPDFKYIRADKAKRYSFAPDYPAAAKAALAEMYDQAGDPVFENGIMKKGMIIRHLILPQNTNSSLEIIDYAVENFPKAYISLMAQYVPCGDLSRYGEINRRITEREYEKVVNYAIDRGIERIFIQERTAADKKYIPPFDFSGVL